MDAIARRVRRYDAEQFPVHLELVAVPRELRRFWDGHLQPSFAFRRHTVATGADNQVNPGPVTPTVTRRRRRMGRF
jgi:hypothetical protein